LDPLFEQLTEQAINSDREYRQEILQQVKRSQETAEIVLFLSAFGTISLTLLWAAYLSSDLFSPLREIQKALDNVSQGDRQKYLDTERADELGEVNQAFNRMLESLQKREKLMELAALKMAGISNSTDNESLWENAPSRLILYQLLKQMRLQLIELDNSHNSNGNIKTGKKQAIVERLAELLQAVTQMAEFGFPLDLNLTQTDIRALLYDLLLTFQDQFVERSISIELEITPEVQQVIVDRLKLREALSQLIDNALETLPERGGRIRILTCITADRQELVIQITNNGTAINKSLLAGILDPTDVFSGQESLFQGRENQKLIGLKLTKAIVEQHGGELIVNSEPDRDNQVLIRLPMVRSQELALKV
jgi:signal transduction histidine kinase